MLLIHGGIDDNVHLQNSEQFAYELQRAGQAVRDDDLPAVSATASPIRA